MRAHAHAACYGCRVNALPTNTSERLRALGIETLNPMQEAALAAIATRRDVVLLSPTGSGKTLAFLLPLVAQLDTQPGHVQALVLVPARELALQIEDVFKRLQTGLKVNCCYGGHDIRTERQNLSQPPALLIGTPGRILDHLQRAHVDLSRVRTLVLDEFDKSLEFGFHESMAAIAGELPALEQRILTSATDSVELPEFVGLRAPLRLDFVGAAATAPRLRVAQVVSPDADKLATLHKLVCKLGTASTLVFLNHREAALRVSSFLGARGVVTAAFHGGLDQDVRERTLAKFRNGSSRILVTTDLASRGLDIPEIEAVVHYHLPNSPEAFTHRNGRTARMHASGAAYVLVGPGESLPEFVARDLPIETLPARDVLPPPPEWVTLWFGKGKKDKVNKVDIVGFLSQKGRLAKDELGLIEVKDFHAFAAVKRARVDGVLKLVRDERLKGQRVKIERAD